MHKSLGSNGTEGGKNISCYKFLASTLRPSKRKARKNSRATVSSLSSAADESAALTMEAGSAGSFSGTMCGPGIESAAGKSSTGAEETYTESVNMIVYPQE